MSSYNTPTSLVIATKSTRKYSSITQAIKLSGLGINVSKLDDSIPECKETGETSYENAGIKALFYYQYTQMNTLAEDDAVYFHGISNNQQPGHLVKRLSEKNGMRSFWSKFIKKNNITSGTLVKSYCLVTKNNIKKSIDITIPFTVKKHNSSGNNQHKLNNYMVPKGFHNEFSAMSRLEIDEFRNKYIVSKLKKLLIQIK